MNAQHTTREKFEEAIGPIDDEAAKRAVEDLKLIVFSSGIAKDKWILALRSLSKSAEDLGAEVMIRKRSPS